VKALVLSGSLHVTREISKDLKQLREIRIERKKKVTKGVPKSTSFRLIGMASGSRETVRNNPKSFSDVSTLACLARKPRLSPSQAN
jgi:hypothetical protein